MTPRWWLVSRQSLSLVHFYLIECNMSIETFIINSNVTFGKRLRIFDFKLI